ncbi:toll-like receptor 3 [Lytechinus variegatus]|uniref:toll-like receptor 3 n=1 Tax=Lytechinus variegatus TaxID=7654 RepID=UPI001BB1309C|nr:toll-like receptor 3 [Lytechinus variegatus]
MTYKYSSRAFHSGILACYFLILHVSIISSRILSENVREDCYQDFELRKAYCNSKGLDSVPQNLAKNIVDLDVSGNNITTLLNSSFERYPMITKLDLSANNLRVIERAAFHPLKNLRTLYALSNRNLVLSDTGLFRWASGLTFLDFSGSNLRFIPDDILKWSKHFDRVDLLYNELSFVNISSCGSVEYADFSSNNIENLTRECFTFTCQTDSLVLAGNPLKIIDSDAIAALKTRSLSFGRAIDSHPFTPDMLTNLTIGISRSDVKELRIFDVGLKFTLKDAFSSLQGNPFPRLDLSLNRIDPLYSHVFSNLARLDKLILDHNDIVTIEPRLFKGMLALKVLSVHSNNIMYINPSNQTWRINLMELDLSANSLVKITQFAFHGLRNLTILDLSSNNHLSFIHLSTFTGLDNVKTINLAGCSITHLQLYTPALNSLIMKRNIGYFPSSPLKPGESFKHTANLVHLDMKNSKIWSYNLWNPTTNVSLFDGLFNLTILDISNNLGIGKSNGLIPDMFHHLSALRELGLDECGIYNLPSSLFSGLESLQKLNLSGNELKQVYAGSFLGLSQLRSVRLDGNVLADLHAGSFSDNPRLTRLSLANNKLTGLNESTFRPIYSSLLQIDLSDNPIVCTCDIKWLLYWLNGRESFSLDNDESTLCGPQSLPSLREKPFLHFKPDELCRFNYAIFSVIPVALVILVCLIVAFVLIHHKRWQLKYKLFLLKLAVWGYRERIDARNHTEYEFDVNFIFCDNDEEWIRIYLRPTLEEQLPQFQRNIFGDADLIAGMYYFDAVDYVVSRSFKTVVALSKAAVRDRWFMLKFRIAMDHVCDTQTEFVTVVFLEDIPDDELPFLVRLYLGDGRPYLNWTGDVRGQEYFWHELEKNLTINLKTNDHIPNE